MNKLKINFKDLDLVITILQRNGWSADVANDISDLPVIKAIHKNGKQILLLAVESDEVATHLDQKIISDFISASTSYGNFKKYVSYVDTKNTESNELVLKSVS